MALNDPSSEPQTQVLLLEDNPADSTLVRLCLRDYESLSRQPKSAF